MNPLWKQKTPHDQLTAIRASLAGHLDNAIDRTVGLSKFIDYVSEHVDQIEELEPYLAGEKPWKVCVKHEHSEIKEYEIKAIEPYTLEQVLDLLENNRAWITPMVNLHGTVPYDHYVQTVVGDEDVTVAHLWDKKTTLFNKWTKQ